jgi:hypothetical protein
LPQQFDALLHPTFSKTFTSNAAQPKRDETLIGMYPIKYFWQLLPGITDPIHL